MTVNGNAGAVDALNINDQNDLDANTYTITGTTVSRAGAEAVDSGIVGLVKGPPPLGDHGF